MDLKNGIIEVDGEIFKPGYMFCDFCDSPFYNNQDGIKIIYLDGKKDIGGHSFIVSLFFRDGKLYMISLICCDSEYTPETEHERKKLHDAILEQNDVPDGIESNWGMVTSDYDYRSNLSSINLIYNI